MSNESNQRDSKGNLRARALARLTGSSTPPTGRSDPSAALQALYELSISPATAPRALALLHELQVHQVELELQDEELRRSRQELEATLLRQVQLYDSAPVAYFTVDRASVLYELNLTAARMLGFERDALVGRALDSFLTPDGARELGAVLTRVGDGAVAATCDLQLTIRDGTLRGVHASANLDPAGGHFLVAFLEAGRREPRSPV